MNTNTIFEAYKNNTDKRRNIITFQNEINKIAGEIPLIGKEIKNVYTYIFKNINPTKMQVGKVNVFSRWGGHYEEMLFLNKEGFSMGSDDLDRRSRYFDKLEDEEFICALKLLHKEQDNILPKISLFKREVFTKFIEAFEESNLHNVLSHLEGYYTYKNVLSSIVTIKYFNSNLNGNGKNKSFDTMDIEYMKMQNGTRSITTHEKGYSRDNIELDDMEKVEQCYDEIMSTLNGMVTHLDTVKKSVTQFLAILKVKFAKELVLRTLEFNDENKK